MIHDSTDVQESNNEDLKEDEEERLIEDNDEKTVEDTPSDDVQQKVQQQQVVVEKIVVEQKPQKIVVELNVDDEYILIDVSDDGPGVPQEKFEDIFKPFFTLDPSRNKLKGESGLGMTIARDIVRSHGGDISLSKSLMGGLKVTIRLPR